MATSALQFTVKNWEKLDTLALQIIDGLAEANARVPVYRGSFARKE